MITPIDIRQQKFRLSFRGYDREEVDAFLAALSKEWQQQLEGHRNLRNELEQLRGRYDTLKEVEDMLHKTLIQAEQSARDTLENARQKADIRLREADLKAREVIQKGVEDRNSLQKDIQELTRRREQLLGQLQLFLRSQLDHLHTMEMTELAAAPKPSPQIAPTPESLLQNGHNGHHGTDANLIDDISQEL